MTTAELQAEADKRDADAATPMGHVWGMGQGTAGDSSGIERTVVTWL
jgi:hypothetical protein